MLPLRTILIALLCFASASLPARANDLPTQTKTKQIWQMLDYLAVDYGRSVKDGAVRNQSEYAEMEEFARTAERQLAELPDSPAMPELKSEAAKLRTSIGNKSSPQEVADQAHALAGHLLATYPIPMAPVKLPELQLGAKLYQSQCASCHGVSGHADGPLSATLNPPPIALADHGRAQERSVFSLQQIITQGVAGTSMRGFTELTDEERWAIAYFASTMSYSDADRQTGAKIWATRPNIQAAVPTLAALTQTSEATLAKNIGPEVARPLIAYLRSTPAVLAASGADSVLIAKSKLKDSVAALEAGDTSQASRLALSAYLDGFEPVEPALAAKNKGLFEDIEKTMGMYRNAVSQNNIGQAQAIEQRLQKLLAEASAALDTSNDPLSTFLGALTILLREGLEALLIVVAMIAFLRKAERTDVLKYVHGGWIAALGSGGLTWVVATYLVNVSGASREMTEGFSAIFAAVVLLAVGIWMHQKSLAGRWQAYVKQKLSAALSKKSAMMLFLLSFVTVYREVFETVLFYAALWTPNNGIYLISGLALGIILLAAIGFLLLRSSARLPISKFFAWSSALVAVLAVVLMGKGVAALQKVGYLGLTPISMPRIDVLGLYPSVQTVLAQVVILLIIVASIAFNIKSQKKLA
ncbi:cytochrome c/FTR1 family iron permease [Undibacterium sp. Jales W-56]|uniref:cytochrome c/FTR1 family iron permease n=1 Tax=Undibacterium sp. Jales W-56 TaxID=2897325 RepID=UPI0021CDF605|nr:cytochrome c/FTR1 family iron permease [Undibacterium sp. Jales W-56]MCU6435305.1 cytochrome c/FTR1 family iron permease [Undibacterium sp. Jales W-56]